MPPASPTVQLTQPTLIARPFHQEGWVYEEKVDGYRMMVGLTIPPSLLQRADQVIE